VQYVIVHVIQGSYSGCISWFKNPSAKVSAHYVVSKGGSITQMVHESDTGWHAGNWSYNQRSIGIEHVGFATKPFAEAEYAASAKLVDHLLGKYGIPRDRAHVIGHDQIPNGTKIASSSPPCLTSPKACESDVRYGGASHHTDPGVWEWATFMMRLGSVAKCNDVTSTWSCSTDKRQAFRCRDDLVEIETCDGACEAPSTGVEAVCHAGPSASAQN
jgi:N-acetyl-anhydromuramyl-L-alanine amidase AmpD